MATPQTIKPLTSAQREHFGALINQLSAAENELATAQRLKDAAQSNAVGFVTYCANELGLSMIPDGWEFAQDKLAFVQKPAQQGNEGDS